MLGKAEELQLHPAEPSCVDREDETSAANPGLFVRKYPNSLLFCKGAEQGVGMGVLEKQMNLCFMLFKMSNRVQKFIFNRRATQSA